MKRRIVCILLAAALLVGLCGAAAGGTTVVLQIGNACMAVGGSVRPVDESDPTAGPIIVDGRTLVPIRAVVEAFGGSCSWDGTTRTAAFLLGGREVRHVVGSSALTSDGRTVTLDAASRIINGRTYLPLRGVIEGLGLQVEWEGTDRLVAVSDGRLKGADLKNLPGSRALAEYKARSLTPTANYKTGTLLVPARSLNAMEPAYDLTSRESVYIPELSAATGYFFSGGHADSTGTRSYQPDSAATHAEAMAEVGAYVALLESLPNFELIKEDVAAGSKPHYYAYLRYTGARPMYGNVPGVLSAGTPDGTHVRILYTAGDRKPMEMLVDKNLTLWDVGLRTPRGGERLSQWQVTGGRAGDPYYKSGGTYYSGADRTLSTTSGKAAFRVNGKVYHGAVRFPEGDYKEICNMIIEGFYGTDAIDLALARNWTRSGDVFGLNALRQQENPNIAQPAISLKDPLFPSGSVSTRDNTSGIFKEAALRVLRFDCSGQGDTVLYFHFKVERDGALYDVEGLAAAPWKAPVSQTGTSSSGSSGKVTCSGCGGSGHCSACGGSGHVSKLMIGQGWVDQTCTDCLGSGDCRWCGGRGTR